MSRALDAELSSSGSDENKTSEQQEQPQQQSLDQSQEDEGDGRDDDDRDSDSDYDGNDGDCSDVSDISEDAEGQDAEAFDDSPDLYLTNMLRDQHKLKGDEAEWVNEYIKAQKDWKAKYGTSIDDVHPEWHDLGAANTLSPSSSPSSASLAAEEDTATGHSHESLLSRSASGSLVFVDEDYWKKHITPRLPSFLQSQNQEQVISLFGVTVIVAVALSFQFYVAFLKT